MKDIKQNPDGKHGLPTHPWSLNHFLPIWVLLSLFCLPASAAEDPLASEQSALIEAKLLSDSGDTDAQVSFLSKATKKFKKNPQLFSLYGEVLNKQRRIGEAEIALEQAVLLDPTNQQASQQLESIREMLDKLVRSENFAAVSLQKYMDQQDFYTSLAIASRAVVKWPENEVFHSLQGEALYKMGRLEEAEAAFRAALKLNPFNDVAKNYVEEIRTTSQAQTSEELAEWISIAKDKLGDFIVTFLALFAAFVANSLVEPIILRLKLNRARRLFERGKYDEFTDLIEGMLDLENFAPIRSNFQFMLKQKGYEESKDILDKYVNTLERLPTLLRILEREHEKQQTTG